MTTNRYKLTELVTNISPANGGDHIVQCGQLLENKMQCTKASSYWVEDLATPDKDKYQVCTAHAAILGSQGRGWAPPILEEEKVEEKKETATTASTTAKPVETKPTQATPQSVAGVTAGQVQPTITQPTQTPASIDKK